MLFPKQVIPFLSDEDDEVRDLAQGYLARAHDPAPATGDDVWSAVDKIGMDRGAKLLALLDTLPLTSNSLARTLHEFHVQKDTNVLVDLELALMKVDFGLLVSHADDLLDDKLGEIIVDHNRDRLKLRDVPLEELWGQMLAWCEENELIDPIEDTFETKQRFVEAIGRYPEAAERAMELLSATSEGNWRETMAADVLGERRYVPAVDELLKKLLIEDADFVHESAYGALVRITNDARVGEVEAFYHSNSRSDSRFFLIGILEATKLVSSEGALLRLLDFERETSHRSAIAAALCNQVSATAIPILREMTLTGKFAPAFVDLKRNLPAVARMTGIPLAEADAWRADVVERNRKRELRRKEMEEYFSNLPHRKSPSQSEPEAPDGDYDPIAPPVTIKRAEPKVGRNDACPCGSGKKYKKCCLDKA